MKTSKKIQKAGELLADALKDLEANGVNENSDLMRFLKDAEIASDHAYEHAMNRENSK